MWRIWNEAIVVHLKNFARILLETLKKAGQTQ
jgi:hypothetical protein